MSTFDDLILKLDAFIRRYYKNHNDFSMYGQEEGNPFAIKFQNTPLEGFGNNSKLHF